MCTQEIHKTSDISTQDPKGESLHLVVAGGPEDQAKPRTRRQRESEGPTRAQVHIPHLDQPLVWNIRISGSDRAAIQSQPAHPGVEETARSDVPKERERNVTNANN